MDTQTQEVGRLMDALELAWGIIANVSHGNWHEQDERWVEAAVVWRDEYWHKALDRNGYSPRPAPTSSAPPEEEQK